MKLRPASLLVLSWLVCLAAPVRAEAPRPLRLAAVSIENRDATVREFTAFLLHLEKLLAAPVEHAHFSRYEDLIEAFREHRVDLAYLGPLPYVQLTAAAAHARPVVRFAEADGAGAYRCVLAASRADRVDPKELAGAPLGLPQPLSTCGPLSATALLARTAAIPLEATRSRVLGNHEAVALALAAGEIRVGTMKESIARKYESLGLEILAATDPIPGFVLVAATDRLGAARVDRLRADLLATPASTFAAWGASIRNGMEAALDADYDGVRRLAREKPR
ncbi:MAG: PhnD/SsuA/transferrin family substrate-binding protein [Siculibacillus sp.]